MSLIVIKYKKSHLYLLLFKLLFLDKSQPCHYHEREQISFCINCFSIDILYYPEKNNPLKFAAEQDSEIEKKENLLLLKFIQNKKQDVAVISYLENIIQNNQTYFIYNICKYEKHPKKGTLVLKFAKKYVFNTKEEITKIAQDIKSVNDDYMEQMIILQIPQIVEKEIP